MDDDELRALEIDAAIGNADARYELGCYYYNEAKDYKKALEYFEMAADKNHGLGAFMAGRVFYEGAKDIEKQPDIAFQYFKKAEKLGETRAYFYIAVCYGAGIGTKIDQKQAYEYYSLGAENGCLESMNNLAWRYIDGAGVEEDQAHGFKLMLEAAKRGSKTAFHNLGRNTNMVDELNNPQLIFAVHEFLADKGDVSSSYRTGINYFYGHQGPKNQDFGVDKNLTLAFKYFSMAAAKGHSESISFINNHKAAIPHSAKPNTDKIIGKARAPDPTIDPLKWVDPPPSPFL